VAKIPDFEFPREEAVNPFEVFSSILRALREQPSLADMVIVDCAPEAPKDNPRSVFTVAGVQTTYIVQVEGDFCAYMQKLSSKSRNQIKRRIRKLEDTAGASLQAACYRTADEMNALHEHLVKVWEKSWHARVGRQHVPSENYLKTLAQAGWIRAYVLVVGDQSVASILGFQYRGTYYYEAPAYNQTGKIVRRE
jgi:CelD/BcsL family acetyltransferase involved in cellulose biosynthesis